MRIIPVIDLSQGQVVHAVAGHREQYHPVCSQLCPDSDPVNIVQAFLDIHTFTTIYIADLDAIATGKPDNACVQKLLRHFPHLDFWLDRGYLNKADIIHATQPRVSHVTGSETGLSPALLAPLLDISPQPVLSLDFKDGGLLGDQTLLQHPEIWPANIIIMNLDRVGTATGVDENLLAQIRLAATHRHIFIAGGIRNMSDVMKLQNKGIAGILIATALHTKQISSADLMTLAYSNAQKKCPDGPGHYHSNG